MNEFPHIYKVGAEGGPEGLVRLSGPNLELIETTPPPQFGGPEGQWSPETLLVASVADCFILTFRAIARASRLEWQGLQCAVDGKLERLDRVTRFTNFHLRATFQVPADTRMEKAERLLHKAEAGCLVTNSLSADIQLDTTIEIVSNQHPG